MADYRESSQRHLWVFASSQQMNDIRDESNQKARQFLVQNHSSTPEEQRAPVEQWACSVAKRSTKVKSESIKAKQDQDILSCNPDGDDFLSPSEEDTLVSFYIHKLPALIGPLAMIPRLRRESKVVATAAMLTRRFFLSNSVMLHDPKRIMVAAAFLALKVEDVTADVRYLEQGTQQMNAPVSIGDICTAEIQLLTGCHFDLLCFHPYKPVLALTEDLRTYLKSDKGKNLVTSAAVNGGGGEGDITRDHHHHLLSGNDLLPIYDAAKLLLERVILSDIPLLYSPARVALAALMVGQEQVLAAWSANGQPSPAPPKIDFAGYLHQRFEDEIMIKQENKLETTTDGVNTLEPLCVMLRSLNEVSEPDLATLKNIHKKLKKVRWWQRSTKKKKKQAREESQVEGGDEPAEGPDNKRQKTK